MFSTYFYDADFKISPYETNEEACRVFKVIITLTTANTVLVEEPLRKTGCIVLTMGSFLEVSYNIARKFYKFYLEHTSQGLYRGQFLPMARHREITEENFATRLPYIVAGKKPGGSDSNERINRLSQPMYCNSYL